MDNILIEQQPINITMSQITNGIHRENGSSVNIENVQMLNGNVGITLQPCDPVDLQFKDVTYTVNLGFTKGKYFFFAFVFFSRKLQFIIVIVAHQCIISINISFNMPVKIHNKYILISNNSFTHYYQIHQIL